jgi:lysophospholipase L1-like esterase
MAGIGVLTAMCSSPSSPTIIIPPPTIACPAAPVGAISVSGPPIPVSYGVPTVAGGTMPVTTTCTPPSGSSFNVGSTTVSCVAIDAVLRANSCTFPVSVAPPPPHLNVINFLAFGDSITAGEIPDCGDTACTMAVQPALSYPAQLQAMLLQRYTQQPTIMVTRDGVPGETAVQGATRLDGELLLRNPDVLLLLEGVNDLDPDDSGSSQRALSALQSMILDARGRNVHVIVSTLLPEEEVMTPGSRTGNASMVWPFNNSLKQMANSMGVPIVDMYSDFLPNLSVWISPLDGLHPTAAGYQEMARVWFNEIQREFESSAAPVPTAVPQRTIR